MSTLQIISPINDARFESLKPVTFTGKVVLGSAKLLPLAMIKLIMKKKPAL